MDVTFPGESALHLTGLGTWTKLAHKEFFSGAALYRHDFDLREALTSQRHVILDFGTGTPTIDTRPPDAPGIHANLDPPIREAAIVSINGQPAGTLWHPPYQLDAGAVKNSVQGQLKQQVTSDRAQHRDQQQAHQRIDVQSNKGKECGVSAIHNNVAMREIDNAGDAKRPRKPHRHQSVDAPEQEGNRPGFEVSG